MCEVFSSARLGSDVNVTFYIIKDFYKQKKINEIFQLLPENSINFNLRKNSPRNPSAYNFGVFKNSLAANKIFKGS